VWKEAKAQKSTKNGACFCVVNITACWGVLGRGDDLFCGLLNKLIEAKAV
jgi:hypothetical protein